MTRFLLAAVSTALLCQAAMAESIIVSTHGLDLTTAAGQTRLEKRIARAAHRICDARTFEPLPEQAAARKCLRDTIQATQTQLANIYAKVPNKKS